jgi:Protein of unknown function (DUF3306)
MSEDNEKFLSRWARLKQETREQPAVKPADAAGLPPELPPLETLDINSDFKGFLHPKVDAKLRHAALKKLFSDPRFNVMDGLDVYIGDYNKADPIPPEMLQQLVQVQNMFASLKKDEPQQGAAQAAPVEGTQAVASTHAALPDPTAHATPRAAPTAVSAAAHCESVGQLKSSSKN